MNLQTRILPDVKTLGQTAAEYLTSRANNAVHARGRFLLALSGGSTPQALYASLAAAPCADDFPWQDTHFFWGDERVVALDHPDSNFWLAHRALLDPAGVPPANVHPMLLQVSHPAELAERHEGELKDFFSTPTRRGLPAVQEPIFDVVLLGMGPDGHVASLFPGDQSALSERDRWVIPVEAPQGKPPGHRLSLTLPVINRAREVVFLVSGANKKEVVRAVVISQALAAQAFPAARVRPAGQVTWFLDQEAAGDLPTV